MDALQLFIIYLLEDSRIARGFYRMNEAAVNDVSKNNCFRLIWVFTQMTL